MLHKVPSQADEALLAGPRNQSRTAEPLQWSRLVPVRRAFSSLAICSLVILVWWSSFDDDGRHFTPLQSLGLCPSDLDSDLAIDLAACSRIPKTDLHLQQQASQLTVHTFLHGQLLESDVPISSSSNLCIIVAVPQSPPEIGLYKDVPVNGYGPDLIHLYLNTSSVLVPIPPLKPLPLQNGLRTTEAISGAILYYAELSLPDEGTYDIAAEREFANWRWAKQWYYNATTKAIEFPTGYSVPVVGTEKQEKYLETSAITNDSPIINPDPVRADRIFPPRITVTSDHSTPKASPKPRCNTLPAFEADKGRWYQPTNANLSTALEDEWGFVYDPDSCTLDYFSPIDVTDCLQDKRIQVLGDSNSRRLARAIISGGLWCHDPYDRCQKEDWSDPLHLVVLNSTTGELEEVWEAQRNGSRDELGDSAIVWGQNTTLHFGFIKSIVMMSESWLAKFYEPDDATLPLDEEGKPLPFEPAQIAADAVARQPPSLIQDPDLVVLGIGAWDEAYAPTFDSFQRTVPRLRDAMLEAYPPSTVLTLRVGHGLCCRRSWTEDVKRYTGGRSAKFRDMMRAGWDIEAGSALDGRVKVLDASGMSGRPEVVNDYEVVGSNHQRAAHVRLEAQILYNQLCVRSGTGRAVWKGS